jgi:polysaccharide pyruvyl transferase WcaK-like protein
MRIVLATGLGSGIYEYGNMGDVAMLQIAVTRLKKLWPSGKLEVLTDSSINLADYCPGTTGLANVGRRIWFSNGVLLGRHNETFPEWTIRTLVLCKRAARLRWPRLLRLLINLTLYCRNRAADIKAVKVFTKAMNKADLVVVCGSGGFYDGCREWNMEILDLVEEAIHRHIPVVMLGQGIGPLNDREVLSRMESLFPAMNLITLRGSPGGMDLLASLGVSPTHVHTTGDEAIELAYEARSKEPGKELGINLRFAGSAETDENDIERIRPVIQKFAKRYAVSIIPVPIAIHHYIRDDLAMGKLLAGFDGSSDGGLTLDSPLKVIQQAGRCRVVVTGAYHAAVFSLAQGIPVVGLSKSPYFMSKFQGLKDQFGLGCETICLNEPDLSERLGSAIERAWQSAEEVRVPLQQAALRQVELTWEAYNRVKDLVTNRAARKSTVSSWRL